ncbi:acetate kinase [Actinopolyspora mzabensis]|uniref:Acetate kinase n=1 Tax=Actinopolyspora mzabensis TaxID=995066 RepID=A0A1G9EI02_ACTMZ|nr:acetate/propionate family kinase [Actinopolyspora mzabensis]SDK75691.1 acetate kinase [Actinopolyspora mzabensis]
MYVLVVNAGSSSLKLRLLDPRDELAASLDLDEWSGEQEIGSLREFVAGAPRIDAVGHRIVHGGANFREPVLIDTDVRNRISELAELAPLHQPRGVSGIDAFSAVLPHVPAVACFDTAFHATLPEAAALYALPREWNEKWNLRRYGFHGLSHAYASRRAATLLRCPVSEVRVITCHLGAGASLAATVRGRSVDTTMGFTPLEGLVMAARSGSVDPGLVLWLQCRTGATAAELSHVLEQRSGLAGMTAGSGDMREVLRGVAAADPAATLAFEVYLHRLRRELAAMTAAAGGLDALVFTGGVGEHSPEVRSGAVRGLGYLGVELDAEHNRTAAADADISAREAPVRTFMINAREDLEIAQASRTVLGNR